MKNYPNKNEVENIDKYAALDRGHFEFLLEVKIFKRTLPIYMISSHRNFQTSKRQRSFTRKSITSICIFQSFISEWVKKHTTQKWANRLILLIIRCDTEFNCRYLRFWWSCESDRWWKASHHYFFPWGYDALGRLSWDILLNTNAVFFVDVIVFTLRVCWEREGSRERLPWFKKW